MAGLLLGCLAAFAQIGGYGGPEILSRNGSNTGDRPGSRQGFQFYAGVYGDYETGLLPAVVNSQGHIADFPALYGIGLQFGVYGRRSWKRTTLGLDYYGNVRHYNANSFYDGSDHMFSMHVSTRATKRLTIYSTTSAGVFSAFYTGGPLLSADLISTPAYSIFDNRAYYLETGAGASYQVSSRLSFSANGTGFFIRRQSRQLVGLDGWGATGQVSYRLNKSRSIIGEYSRIHYDYPRGFGESEIDSITLGINQRLNRRWQLGLAAGASRIGTIGLEMIAADPLTAALFGVTSTIQAFQASTWMGIGTVMLNGQFRRSNFTFSAMQMPNGGNGVYLTSRATMINGIYTYTGIRRVSMYLSANYSSLRSIGQQSLGTFSYFSAGVGGSYRIRGSLEATTEFDTRDLQISQATGFARLSYRVMLGLNFHPGEIPISLR